MKFKKRLEQSIIFFKKKLNLNAQYISIKGFTYFFDERIIFTYM